MKGDSIIILLKKLKDIARCRKDQCVNKILPMAEAWT